MIKHTYKNTFQSLKSPTVVPLPSRCFSPATGIDPAGCLCLVEPTPPLIIYLIRPPLLLKVERSATTRWWWRTAVANGETEREGLSGE
ncbi:hypothetical protein Hanom_Chr07g00632351 [Helianthus anomalus]